MRKVRKVRAVEVQQITDQTVSQSSANSLSSLQHKTLLVISKQVQLFLTEGPKYLSFLFESQVNPSQWKHTKCRNIYDFSKEPQVYTIQHVLRDLRDRGISVLADQGSQRTELHMSHGIPIHILLVPRNPCIAYTLPVYLYKGNKRNPSKSTVSKES